MGIFDSAIGPIVSAAGSFFGQGSANAANRDIANNANAASAAQAQANRDFQERMSNTTWQRGVADMRKAGINPAIAFSQGGASSPAGSVGSVTTGAPMQDRLGKATSSALSAASLKSSIDNVMADTALKKVNTENAAAQHPAIVANSNLDSTISNFSNDALAILKNLLGYNTDVATAKDFAKHPIRHIASSAWSSLKDTVSSNVSSANQFFSPSNLGIKSLKYTKAK